MTNPMKMRPINFTILTLTLVGIVARVEARSFQEAYLKPSNTNAADRFGVSVAACGDTIVIGASREESASRLINGDSTDNTAPDAGAAYVFVRSGSDWVQQAYLKASNADADDRFGFDVDIDGDTIVVGAHLEKSAVTGINGIESDNSLTHAGAVYVFTRAGTVWTQQAYIKPPNTDHWDFFGGSVSLCGDTLVVGSPEEDSDAVGVGGDPFNNNRSGSGACYVFERVGTIWTQEAYIKASNPGELDFFGTEATISGDTIAVGAFREDSASSGINGVEGDDSSMDSGSAYIFVRSGTTWVQQAYLKASNPGEDDLFGYRIGIDGDLVLVGARNEDSGFSPFDGSGINELALNSGAAYAFHRTGTTWVQEAYLKASNAEADDTFGWSFAVVGSDVLIGAVLEDGASSGVNGDQANNDEVDSGAVYRFRRSGTSWSQAEYIKASNPDAGDEFGAALAMLDGTIIVGAQWEDGGSSGVNGSLGSNTAIDAGAVYVLNREKLFDSSCIGDGGDQMGCTDCPCMNNAASGTIGGCLNSVGTATRIYATGDTSTSLPAGTGTTTDLRFNLDGAPSGAFCVLLSGSAVAPQSMGNMCFGLDSGAQSLDRDGLRCAVMNLKRHGGRSANMLGEINDSTGPSRVWGGEAQPHGGIYTQGGFSAGQTRYFQVTHREDPTLGCMRGLNTSQAIEVVFTP